MSPVKINSKRPISELDSNAEPDEMAIDPKYFDFLQVDQLTKLDAISFYFDGYAALTRRSVADRLKLSDTTHQKVRRTVAESRKQLFFPRFWWTFAARLPADIKYQDCEFAGKLCAYVGLKVMEHLSEDECQRVTEFLRTVPEEVIAEVKRLAPLPEGIQALRKYVGERDLLGFSTKG